MRNHYIKSFVLALLSALALSACGGGGGDGGSPAAVNTAPTDPNAYSLIPLKSLAASTMTFALTGRDSTAVTYTASLKISNLTAVYIPKLSEGPIIPIQSEASLTNQDTHETTTSVGTSYYATGYKLVATTMGPPGNVTATCTPSNYQAPPNSALVGDHDDNFAQLNCKYTDDTLPNSTTVITWRLEDGPTPGTDAKFVVTETSYVGTDVTIEVDSYIIDHAGNVKGIEVKVTDETTGKWRFLSGDKLP